MFYTCNSSSHLSSSGFRIACMFDELYNFKCRQIQKLILVYHESHLMQAKILSMIHKPWAVDISIFIVKDFLTPSLINKLLRNTLLIKQKSHSTLRVINSETNSRLAQLTLSNAHNLQLMNQQLGGEFFQGNFELKVLKTFWIQTAEQQYLDGECPWKTAKPEVSRIMRDNRQTKIKLILSSEMERENDNSHSSFKIHFCTSKLSKILGQQMNQKYWMFSCKHLTKKFRIFNQRGSNWRYQRVISLDIHPAEYTSLNGSSCIKLPIISKGRKQYKYQEQV